MYAKRQINRRWVGGQCKKKQFPRKKKENDFVISEQLKQIETSSHVVGKFFAR